MKQRPIGKTFTSNLCELRNDMLSEANQKVFEPKLQKLAKYYRKNILSKARQKSGGKLYLFGAKGAKKVILNRVEVGHAPSGSLGPLGPLGPLDPLLIYAIKLYVKQFSVAYVENYI